MSELVRAEKDEAWREGKGGGALDDFREKGPEIWSYAIELICQILWL